MFENKGRPTVPETASTNRTRGAANTPAATPPPPVRTNRKRSNADRPVSDTIPGSTPKQSTEVASDPRARPTSRKRAASTEISNSV